MISLLAAVSFFSLFSFADNTTCSNAYFNDSFNYDDLFANHGWTYSSGQASNATPIIENNPFELGAWGYDQDNTKPSNYARTITHYFDNTSTERLIIRWNQSFSRAELDHPDALRVILKNSGAANPALYVRIGYYSASYINISVKSLYLGGTNSCDYAMLPLPIIYHITWELDLDNGLYSLYLNDTKICDNYPLNATFAPNKLSLEHYLYTGQDLGIYTDDLFVCEGSVCGLGHPENCPHYGPQCMDAATWCADAFFYGGDYYCDISDTVECGCEDDVCVGGEICTAGFEHCCSPPVNETSGADCSAYNSTGDLYICSGGLSWSLLQLCNFGCTESGDAFYASCDAQNSFYCYNSIQDRCFYSTANATGLCWSTLSGCSGYQLNATGGITTAPSSGDLSTVLEANYCTFGICSAASRVIISLIIMLIVGAAIVIFSLSHQVLPNFAVLGTIEVMLMILLVYVKLLPLWIPIVITIFGVGTFAFMIGNKISNGEG